MWPGRCCWPAPVSYTHLLVNGEAANEMPHLGDAWVVLHLEDEAVGLAGFFCELLLERVGVCLLYTSRGLAFGRAGGSHHNYIG